MGHHHHSSQHAVAPAAVKVVSAPVVKSTSTFNNQNGQHNIDLSGSYNSGSGTNTKIGDGYDQYNN